MGQMLLLLLLALWVRVPMDSAAQAPSPADITNPGFIDECVRAHNYYRSNVNPSASDMLYMTWDPALAKSAKAWARHCTFSHNPLLQSPGKVHPEFSPVGENLWVGSPKGFAADKAIQHWHSEVASYDYANMNCSNVCGHYKQVVWASSYKVGCAAQLCPTVKEFTGGKAIIFVCNYGDAGNRKGVRPYRQGAVCSACSGGSCRDSLCRDPKRDESSSTSWSPAWDPGATSSSPCSPAALLMLPVGYGLGLLLPN